jgi:phosphonate transport system substrate-binding protein
MGYHKRVIFDTMKTLKLIIIQLVVMLKRPQKDSRRTLLAGMTENGSLPELVIPACPESFFVFASEWMLKIRITVLFIALVALPNFVGCEGGKKTTIPPDDPVAPKKVFRIALLPDQNVFYQKRRYRSLAKYLSSALGMDVRTKILDSYGAVYDEMLSDKVDAAFFGSLSYLIMTSEMDIEPIARPVRKNGISTYRGVIFTLKDKGITEDIQTWKGKRLALVSKSTTSGYLFPRWYLYRKGVDHFQNYFGKIIYVGSHDASVLAVIRGEADLGCSTDRVFNRFLERDPTMKDKLVVLASSTAFPSNTLGVKGKDFGPGFEERLKDALLNMNKSEEGRNALLSLGITGFMETNKADYEPVHTMMRDLGLKPEFFALDEIGVQVPNSGAVER